jgi:hypothetical protein
MSHDHEWIEVGPRRWCLCCSIFQYRRPGDPWPRTPRFCRWDTMYAARLENSQ